MEALELIRRHARRRLPEPRLRADASACGAAAGAWGSAEAHIFAEVQGSPRRASRLVRAFADVADASGSTEARGRAARLASSYASYVGQHEAALEHCAVAESLLRGAARDGARLGAAAALLRLGRSDAAVDVCRRVRRSARGRSDAVLAAAADLNEAVALHESGRPERALRLYSRAADVLGKTGPASLHAAALQNRGNALVLLDRFDEAREPLEAAAKLFADLGASHDAARCRYNVGALLSATDRLGEADATLLDAEQRLADGGDTVEAALARVDRGEVLLRAGLAHEAARLLGSARRGLLGAPPIERERARLLEARALLASGRTRAARARLRAPVARGMAALEAARHEILGLLALSAHRATDAMALLQDAARRFRRAGRPVAAARAFCASAWSAHLARDARRARAALRSADGLVPAGALPSLDFAREAVRFVLAVDAGRRSAADEALAAAFEALEAVRGGLGTDVLSGALLRGREAWFARAIRHVLGRDDGAAAALDLLERWRARALRDLLEGIERIGGDDGLDALRSSIRLLERRLESDPGPDLLRGRSAVAPARILRDLGTAERRLRDALALRPSRQAALPDIGRLRRSLASRDLVIALFADERGTLVFAIDRKGLHVHRSPVALAEIERRVERLRFLLGQHELGEGFVVRHAARLRRKIDAALAALADVALAPFAGRIEAARRVVIVPHGAWHHVPFAALPVSGRPLVCSADVALAPALGVLGTASRAGRGRPVVVTRGDASAPSIAREARDVAQSLGAELLDGAAASLESLRARRSPSCLHIAAHGRYRADAPAMSGVRLADGWLRAAELPALHLRGSTVVLSGCETGLSAVGAGDEVQGLVRGVFAGGARELVASLWRVDDPATAALMVRFHEERRAGVRAESALSTAQRAAIEAERPVWYWAGFQTWTRRR